MSYQPATNTSNSAGLAHLASVFYKKTGLSRLMKKFVFRDACMDDMLPKAVGKTVQFFRYSNFGTNTTPTVEGTVGTGLSMTSKVLAATVSQYSAFITISDLANITAIDSQVTAASDLLGYQAGLSVDTMTRNVIDDQSAGTNQSLLGTYFRVADLRASRSALQAVDVEPFDDKNFLAVVHPFVSYDLVNDPAAGGLADIYKYTNPTGGPLVKYEDRGFVTNVAGCKVIESTNVKTGTDSNSNTTYRVYVFGKGGVGCVDLAGRAPSDVKDPAKQSFKINVVNGGVPSIPDPEGVIGAAVSYNFVFTSVILDGPAGIGGTYRYKTIDAISSIA